MNSQETSAKGNTLSEFPESEHRFLAFCDACGHKAFVDRAALSPTLTVAVLVKRLRCSKCGSRDTQLRIVFNGAGEYRYGR